MSKLRGKWATVNRKGGCALSPGATAFLASWVFGRVYYTYKASEQYVVQVQDNSSFSWNLLRISAYLGSTVCTSLAEVEQRRPPRMPRSMNHERPLRACSEMRPIRIFDRSQSVTTRAREGKLHRIVFHACRSIMNDTSPYHVHAGLLSTTDRAPRYMANESLSIDTLFKRNVMTDCSVG
jgi:hypothetical protein